MEPQQVLLGETELELGELRLEFALPFMGIGIHGTPVGNRLDVLDIAADGQSATRTSVSLPMPAGRFRSVVQGPDGSLYVATDEGTISKLTPG